MSEMTLESLIEELRNRIPYLQCHNEFIVYYDYIDMDVYHCWLAKTIRFINTAYPDDKDVIEFERISQQDIGPNQQHKLLAILEAFAALPSVIPAHKTKPATTKMDSDNPTINVTTHINNTNSQEQSQEQSLAVEIFIEAIKDDLTSKQIKELKAVVAEADNDLEKARPSIIEKLKSFGSDVVSNIVANILTIPAIWGGI